MNLPSSTFINIWYASASPSSYGSKTLRISIYLGCRNLPYFGNFPDFNVIAVFVIPSVTECPALSTAVTGDATKPSTPLPTPLKNPAVPSLEAPSNGFVKTPVTPSKISFPPPTTPWYTPSSAFSDLFLRQCILSCYILGNRI